MQPPKPIKQPKPSMTRRRGGTKTNMGYKRRSENRPQSRNSMGERLVSFLVAVWAGLFFLGGLEIATGQLIVPRPWWLGLEETPYCLACSEKIDSAVRRAYAEQEDKVREDRDEKRIKGLDEFSPEERRSVEDLLKKAENDGLIEREKKFPRKGAASYDELHLGERVWFRFGVILGTKDAAALWDTFLGAGMCVFWGCLSLFLFWCASLE